MNHGPDEMYCGLRKDHGHCYICLGRMKLIVLLHFAFLTLIFEECIHFFIISQMFHSHWSAAHACAKKVYLQRNLAKLYESVLL